MWIPGYAARSLTMIEPTELTTEVTSSTAIRIPNSSYLDVKNVIKTKVSTLDNISGYTV